MSIWLLNGFGKIVTPPQKHFQYQFENTPKHYPIALEPRLVDEGYPSKPHPTR
jgi:hypothetical protein